LLALRDREREGRAISVEAGAKCAGRRLVDEVGERPDEFGCDRNAGKHRHEAEPIRTSVRRLLLLALARERAVEGRTVRCWGVPRLRCPLDLLLVFGLDSRSVDFGFVAFDASVVDFRFVVFDVIGHGDAGALWSSGANVSERSP
jgi:hypothetical protein